MTRQEAAIAITNEFVTNFNSTTPVSFDNQVNFWLCTSPLTATTKPSSSTWVTFNVVDNTTPTITIGNKGARRWKRAGFISSQVFISEGTGTSAGRTICEEIIDIFEGERIASDIVFTYGEYLPIGSIESGWYQYDITIYFSFYETK